MSTPSTEVIIQKLTKCVNHLISQSSIQMKHANYLNKLLNNYIPETLPEMPIIPEKLLQLTNIKTAVKRIICEEVSQEGIEAIGNRYSISCELIRKWQGVNEEVKSLPKFMKTEEPKEPNSIIHSMNQKRSVPEKCKTAENTEDMLDTDVAEKPYYLRKPIQIFLHLNNAEKHRIFYDYIKIGRYASCRKWGLHMTSCRRNFGPEETDEESKQNWLDMNKSIVQKRKYIVSKIGEKKLVEKIENIVKERDPTVENLQEVVNQGLDKGIALVATKYGIDLFEFEYLIKNVNSVGYFNMKKNNWFLGPYPAKRFSTPGLKTEIVKCYLAEGAIYASKKFHIALSNVTTTYNQYLRSISGCTRKEVKQMMREKHSEIMDCLFDADANQNGLQYNPDNNEEGVF